MTTQAHRRHMAIAHSQHTWTYSIGDISPGNRLTAILLAGYAFGSMLTELRFRWFVTTRDDMVTAKNRA
jgi:hypothetical protein